MVVYVYTLLYLLINFGVILLVIDEGCRDGQLTVLDDNAHNFNMKDKQYFNGDYEYKNATNNNRHNQKHNREIEKYHKAQLNNNY